MSDYAAVEALWLTRIRAVTGFDSMNTSRGDWSIVNNGDSDVYVVLKPGEHNREMIALTTRQDTWQTIIEVWQKLRDDGSTLAALEANYNTLLTNLDQYPRLGDTGGTVRLGQIVAVNEVLQNPPDAPSWLVAQMIGITHEETIVNFQE